VIPLHFSKRTLLSLVGVGVFLLAIFLLYPSLKSKLPPPPSDALYRQAGTPTEERIEDLLSRMTIEEKVGQMALVEKNSVLEPEDVAKYGLGAILSGMGAKPENNTVEGWDTMVTDFIRTSRESRLGIPIMYGADAIHGHSNVSEATIFPHSLGLGATRDSKLVERIARATGDELRATNIRWSFSPTLDLPRDIRWGRTYEAFSDDPELTAELGAAYVRGLQGGKDGGLSVLSTVKHFIGLGSMVWGSSSNENFKIDQGTTEPDEESLRNEYLTPFKAVVDNGAMSVMIGLNSWGETKLGANSYLITDVLKGELGFAGFTVSDWYGVYEVTDNDYDSAVIAINAGIDMVMLPYDYKPFIQNVTRAVKKGEISESRIDDAVRRILRAKFKLGLFDTEEVKGAYDVIGSEAHRALAREAVAKSLVLLKNTTNVLPIKKSVTHIRVAGSSAHNVGRQMGAWTVEWQGIDGNWLPGGTSILDGIRARAGTGVEVEYDTLGNFRVNSKKADVGIAIVGEGPYAEGWGDTEYPILSKEDREVIEKLQATSEKVIVIIVSGRPLFVTREIPAWDAVVMAWLPGSEGAGVADVLFGDKPFTGVLPLPWPHHSEQLPISSQGVTADGTKVLFPRSYGLRY
jgi:beta-glucosidase